MRVPVSPSLLFLFFIGQVLATPRADAIQIKEAFRNWREQAYTVVRSFQRYVTDSAQEPRESFELQNFLGVKNHLLEPARKIWEKTGLYLDAIKKSEWSEEDRAYLSETQRLLSEIRVKLHAEDSNLAKNLVAKMVRSFQLLSLRMNDVSSIHEAKNGKFIDPLSNRLSTSEERQGSILERLLDKQIQLGGQISRSQSTYLVGKLWKSSSAFDSKSDAVARVTQLLEGKLDLKIAEAKELYRETFAAANMAMRRAAVSVARIIIKVAKEILEVTGQPSEVSMSSPRGVISGVIKHTSRYGTPESSRSGSRNSPRDPKGTTKFDYKQAKKVSFAEEPSERKLDPVLLSKRLEEEIQKISPRKKTKIVFPSEGATVSIREKLRTVDEALKKAMTWVFEHYEDLYHTMNLNELAQTIEGNFNILLDAYKKLYIALPRQDKNFKWIDWRIPLTAVSLGADIIKPENNYWLDQLGMADLRDKLSRCGPSATLVPFDHGDFCAGDEQTESLNDEWDDNIRLPKMDMAPGNPLTSASGKGDTSARANLDELDPYDGEEGSMPGSVANTPMNKQTGPTTPLWRPRGDSVDPKF